MSHNPPGVEARSSVRYAAAFGAVVASLLLRYSLVHFLDAELPPFITLYPAIMLVAILWGRDAGTLRPLLGSTPIIASAHPSPLSASSGFFGSRPFSRANDMLVQLGAKPVDWALPA